MDGYEKVGTIGKISQRALLKIVSEAHFVPNESEDEYFGTRALELEPLQRADLLKTLPKEGWLRAFAIKIPPGGHMSPHYHHDVDHVKYHIALATNEQCVSRNGGTIKHLAEREINRMAPAEMHESHNRGETDRIHLVIQIKREADAELYEDRGD